MLVLTRQPGEKILIGDDIYIVIDNVKGDRVRLCISAPSDVSIDRAEVRARKEAERIDRTARDSV